MRCAASLLANQGLQCGMGRGTCAARALARCVRCRSPADCLARSARDVVRDLEVLPEPNVAALQLLSGHHAAPGYLARSHRIRPVPLRGRRFLQPRWAPRTSRRDTWRPHAIQRWLRSSTAATSSSVLRSRPATPFLKLGSIFTPPPEARSTHSESRSARGGFEVYAWPMMGASALPERRRTAPRDVGAWRQWHSSSAGSRRSPSERTSRPLPFRRSRQWLE